MLTKVAVFVMTAFFTVTILALLAREFMRAHEPLRPLVDRIIVWSFAGLTVTIIATILLRVVRGVW
jgi:hypothetical protein